MKLLSKQDIIVFLKGRKLRNFLLFLLLSIGVLVLLKLDKRYTYTMGFKINQIHVPQTLIPLNANEKQLNLTFNTTGFNYLGNFLVNRTLKIDFNTLKKNNPKSYVWRKQDGLQDIVEQLPKSVELLTITPDNLLLEYDIYTVKNVPVKVNTHITYAAGYNLLDSLRITPDTIQLIGPEKVLSNIHTIATDSLILDAVNTDINTSLKLKTTELNSEIKINHNHIKLSGKVEKFTESLVNVPVTMVNVPESITIKYAPKSIPVIFSTSLSTLKSIKPENFTIICDYNDVNKRASFIIPKLTAYPKNIKAIRLNVNKVELILIE